jgi:hypothetical protein
MTKRVRVSLPDPEPAKGRGGKRAGSGRKRGATQVASVNDKREVAQYARQFTTQAIDRLVALMQSRTEAVALAAVDKLLDRAVGKPGQATEITSHQTVVGLTVSPELVKQMDADGLRELHNTIQRLHELRRGGGGHSGEADSQGAEAQYAGTVH